MTATKYYVIYGNTAQVVKLKMHVLQLINANSHNINPTRHQTRVAQQKC